MLLDTDISATLDIGSDQLNMFHSNEYDDLAGGYPFPGKEDIVHWTAFNSDI